MSKHPLQFIEIPRKDPEKEIPEVRIKHFDEIYESYDGAEAAAQRYSPADERCRCCSGAGVPWECHAR